MQRSERLAFEWRPADQARRCDMPRCFLLARYALMIVTVDAAGAERRLPGGECCAAHAQQRSEGLGVDAPGALASAQNA
jgi:hypothetical protein